MSCLESRGCVYLCSFIFTLFLSLLPLISSSPPLLSFLRLHPLIYSSPPHLSSLSFLPHHPSLPFSLTAIVHIEPIANIDISDRAVGQTLSISCQVITCQERLTVSILKGSQLVVSEKYSNKKNISLSADMIISADTADRYACRVLLETGTVFNEPFTVSGSVVYLSCIRMCVLWLQVVSALGCVYYGYR